MGLLWTKNLELDVVYSPCSMGSTTTLARYGLQNTMWTQCAPLSTFYLGAKSPLGLFHTRLRVYILFRGPQRQKTQFTLSCRTSWLIQLSPVTSKTTMNRIRHWSTTGAIQVEYFHALMMKAHVSISLAYTGCTIHPCYIHSSYGVCF